MNFEDLKKLSELGVGLALASRNESLIPFLDDLAGLYLHPDGTALSCFINSAEAPKALENLQLCPEIAISLSRPCDYFTAQIKGKVTEVRKMTPEEEIISKNWADLYRQEMILVSVPPEVVFNLKMNADTAIDVSIEDIFIQTPGIQAGARIEL